VGTAEPAPLRQESGSLPARRNAEPPADPRTGNLPARRGTTEPAPQEEPTAQAQKTEPKLAGEKNPNERPYPVPSPSLNLQPGRNRSKILFDVDSHALSKEDTAALDQLAQDWKQNGGAINLYGHASTTGPCAHNQELSQERVDASRDYLVSKGVPADKIRTEADGCEKNLPKQTAMNVEEQDNRSVTFSRDPDGAAPSAAGGFSPTGGPAPSDTKPKAGTTAAHHHRSMVNAPA
jgi:outer membrane protein OmpA-like peptidoglycan-associated protein